MRNAEVLASALKDADDIDVLYSVAPYIRCPYVHNPECTYTRDKGETCDECKVEWLRKEWDE